MKSAVERVVLRYKLANSSMLSDITELVDAVDSDDVDYVREFVRQYARISDGRYEESYCMMNLLDQLYKFAKENNDTKLINEYGITFSDLEKRIGEFDGYRKHISNPIRGKNSIMFTPDTISGKIVYSIDPEYHDVTEWYSFSFMGTTFYCHSKLSGLTETSRFINKYQDVAKNIGILKHMMDKFVSIVNEIEIRINSNRNPYLMARIIPGVKNMEDCDSFTGLVNKIKNSTINCLIFNRLGKEIGTVDISLNRKNDPDINEKLPEVDTSYTKDDEWDL